MHLPLYKAPKFILLTAIFFSFITASCDDSNNKVQSENIPSSKILASEEKIRDEINSEDYDSVVFYKHVNWVNFKGENKIIEKEKYYPFTAYCYKNKTTELKIFLSKNKPVIRHIKNYKGYQHIQTKYYSRDERDTVFCVRLLVNDTAAIEFYGMGNQLIYDGNSKEDIYLDQVNLILMSKDNILKNITYSQMHTQKTFSLDTLIKNIIRGNNFVNDYESKNEEILELKNGNIYHLYDFTDKKERKEEYLQTKNIIGNSFFYYYTDVRSFFETVY